MPNRQPTNVKQHIARLDKPSPDALLRAFGEVLQARKEYAITVELETTKRAAIAASLRVRLEELQLCRDSFGAYLEKEYKMRSETIAGIFDRLDQAMKTDKDDVAVQALKSLEGIIKDSPLSGALSAVSQILNKKDAILEI